MADKRASGRSLDEWMDLVTECRQSGLTDAAWCNEHGISPSCFYNAVTRLRKKACQIPEPAGKASTLDLTSHKQDVVQITIEPEDSPAELLPHAENSSMYLDEYSCAMKSHFRKFGNQMSGSGNHLCNYASLLA